MGNSTLSASSPTHFQSTSQRTALNLIQHTSSKPCHHDTVSYQRHNFFPLSLNHLSTSPFSTKSRLSLHPPLETVVIADRASAPTGSAKVMLCARPSQGRRQRANSPKFADSIVILTSSEVRHIDVAKQVWGIPHGWALLRGTREITAVIRLAPPDGGQRFKQQFSSATCTPSTTCRSCV